MYLVVSYKLGRAAAKTASLPRRAIFPRVELVTNSEEAARRRATTISAQHPTRQAEVFSFAWSPVPSVLEGTLFDADWERP